MAVKLPAIQTENLEAYDEGIKSALQKISEQNLVARIWDKDWTVWKDESKEISNRLGWLDSPPQTTAVLPRVEKLVARARHKGYTHALLLGMGGSSLAPEVLSDVFGTRKGYLKLEVLDSTVPEAVLNFRRTLDPEKTLFIVSSKSGETVETLSLFNFFFNWAADSLGKEKAGEHFIAITDPGTPLEKSAVEYHFQEIFNGDPDIGGRFSALSVFGIVPAALTGIDVRELLKRGQEMAGSCRLTSPLQENPGIFLGTILACLARSGRDKLTFILSPRTDSFFYWLEQLLAESTGKEGKGILPVIEDDDTIPGAWGSDRLFINIHLEGDRARDRLMNAIKQERQPCLRLDMTDLYSLGSQFFLWEMATAAAGSLLRINPFDQPNVAASKKKSQELIRAFKEKKVEADESPQFSEQGLSLFTDTAEVSLKKSLEAFFGQAKPGDYVGIQAFLCPTPETGKALREMRARIQHKTKLAVTVGYGPRYLHSTGQLHKGDRGNGLFIQLMADDEEDAPVPDQAGRSSSSLSFGTLKKAQAIGDWQALREAGRRVLRFHLQRTRGLETLISML